MAAYNAVPPVGGQEEAISVLDSDLVHLGICEVWELIKLRLGKVDWTVVVGILTSVTFDPSTRVDKTSLEWTDYLEFFPAYEHAHEVFIFISVR